MKHIDTSRPRHTSVTMRTSTHKALRQGVLILSERKIEFSEQQLMRECLRIALRLWRGRRQIAGRNKKYNRCAGPYEIVPFYTTEALRSAACARCHHAGMSLSRLVDFSVSHYLQRVLEYWLRFDYRWRDRRDVDYWRAKYAQRRNASDFVISYKTSTQRNDCLILDFGEKVEILPWPPPDCGTT